MAGKRETAAQNAKLNHREDTENTKIRDKRGNKARRHEEMIQRKGAKEQRRKEKKRI
jgi:hypothetical protein